MLAHVQLDIPNTRRGTAITKTPHPFPLHRGRDKSGPYGHSMQKSHAHPYCVGYTMGIVDTCNLLEKGVSRKSTRYREAKNQELQNICYYYDFNYQELDKISFTMLISPYIW